MLFSVKKITFFAIACFGFALRTIVSLYPYSGAATPPMYGDYEAQRHWQEICVNLPASTWYTNTTDNDLLYWGLDYPPLTAYHSWCVGKLAERVDASFIRLHSSRGYESEDHKFFMRLSVLVMDLLLYIPVMCLAIVTLNKLPKRKLPEIVTFQHLAICLWYPGQILIDNGHFQYNNISLGLALLAIAGIMLHRPIWASICFSLALNYKQMELYHAIPFFVYLLRSCTQEKSLTRGLMKLTIIGSSVVITFLILWLPWINSWTSFTAVVRRIFPINRGVFEDKVSNVWCALNVFVKLKTIFSNESMALVCFVTTVVVLLPSAFQLYRNSNKINFLYALFNSAMTFFLFSFQVHEKSILLAALPAMLLYPFEPFIMSWFLQISTFSMFPLLQKDKLTVPFVGMLFIYEAIVKCFRKLQPMVNDHMANKYNWLYVISRITCVLLMLCHLFVPVPQSLPHIFVLAISVFSCLHFVAFLFYTNYKQFLHKNVGVS